MLGTTAALLAAAAISGGAGMASSAIANKKNRSPSTSSLGTTKEALDKFNGPTQMIPKIERVYNPPPPGYRPGIDPEHQFYVDKIVGYQPLTSSSWTAAAKGMAEGGEVPRMDQTTSDAIAALQGRHPNPQKAVEAFVQEYGQDAFYDLRSSVLGQGGQSGNYEGRVSGPGSGTDDLVPARGPGRDILLSDGEFVIPADVVSGLGDGSTDAGSKKLHMMMDRVRQTKTGSPTAPRKASGSLFPA
jgi:hypothetical protein